MQRIIVRNEDCLGCRLCEIICSSAHEGAYNPKRSRIRVPITFPLPSPPVVCRQCAKAPCVGVCSTGALTIGEHVEFDSEKCVGCGQCAAACPFQAIWVTPEGSVCKCDLCGGSPNCVGACPGAALSYDDGGESNEN